MMHYTTHMTLQASSSADLQQYRVMNRELHRQVKSLDQQNKELEAHFMRQVTRVAAQAASEVGECGVLKLF
jgi:uncharacterized membrane-anchored protein YhcB (DUF1043 family)